MAGQAQERRVQELAKTGERGAGAFHALTLVGYKKMASRSKNAAVVRSSPAGVASVGGV